MTELLWRDDYCLSGRIQEIIGSHDGFQFLLNSVISHRIPIDSTADLQNIREM